MKKTIILAILLMFIAGCSAVQKTTPTINTIQDLMLDSQDLQQLGLTSNTNETYRQMFEISNGTDCRIDEEYTNIVDSSPGQYSICDYTLNDTDIIIEFQKFANYEALNGSYQYGSEHLYSVEGLMSENDYGDQSRFRVNNVNDYGGQFNPPGVYFYHLWFTKGLYMIHITSKGTDKEAKDDIAKIGRLILGKMGG
ncbi:MAG: hypothetical protein NT001_04790 [Candidatus Woesearchaeota archaeon]|nr:hypothetical protein [Candidatus Woesearchaeota archaeon]